MARDGSVSQLDYEKVEALAQTGMKKSAAIKAVAEELGKQPASVQNNYYRIARQKTGGRQPSTVSRRGRPARRSQRVTAAAPAADRSLDGITRDLVTSIEQLTNAVKAQSAEVADLQGRLDGVRKLLTPERAS